jgi:hypothetical protein
VAAAAGLSSGAALVIAILTSRPLWATSVFIVVPGLVAFVALSVTVRRDEQQLFLTRLRVGLLAGLLATIAYDVSRWAVEVTNLTQTNSFVAIRAFGFGLTGRPRNDGIAMAAGWAFHYVNGVGFAVAYLFVAARRRWWWAIGYALVLESFLVTLYPGWLNLQLSSEFLSVSIGGHVAYGTVLGLMARRTP